MCWTWEHFSVSDCIKLHGLRSSYSFIIIKKINNIIKIAFDFLFLPKLCTDKIRRGTLDRNDPLPLHHRPALQLQPNGQTRPGHGPEFPGQDEQALPAPVQGPARPARRPQPRAGIELPVLELVLLRDPVPPGRAPPRQRPDQRERHAADRPGVRRGVRGLPAVLRPLDEPNGEHRCADRQPGGDPPGLPVH